MSYKMTNIKEIALRNFLYKWMEEPEKYCNYCGMIYREPPEGIAYEPCCEKPHIGTNLEFLYLLIQENKIIRESRTNKFASNKDKNMRWGLSLTPRLMHDLEEFCINTLKEPFLKDKQEMDEFMRSFPEFRTCEVV